MGSAKDRVHPRYRVDLAATARWRRTVLAARVFDVSQSGAFLAGDEHPNLRELVRIEFEVPGRAEPFAVHGMAVNFAHVGDVEGRPHGFGVQLYAMDREMQRVWAQFIDLVKRGGLPRPAEAPAPPPRPPPRAAPPEDDLPPLVIPEPLMRTPVARIPMPRAAIESVPAPPAGTRTAIPAPAPARPAPVPAPQPAVAAGKATAPKAAAPKATAPMPPRPPAPPPPRMSGTTAAVASPPPIKSLPPARRHSPLPSPTSGSPRPISLRPGSSTQGPLEFEVDVQSMEELELFFERDASLGGMFIPTTLDLRVRAAIKVFLRHPQEGSYFELDARVSHVECDLDAPGVGVEFMGFTDAKRAALRAFVYGAEPAPAPAPVPAPAPAPANGIWDFEPLVVPNGLQVPAPEDDALARIFDAWDAEVPQRPWSRPPPDDEFNLLFDALHEHEESGLRRSVRPSAAPSDEAAPDFRMSIPSWSVLQAAPSVIPLDDVVDLTDDDTIDLEEATPLPQSVDAWSRRHAAR